MMTIKSERCPVKAVQKPLLFLPSLFAHLWLSQLSQEGGGKGETECAAQPNSVKNAPYDVSRGSQGEVKNKPRVMESGPDN